MIMKVRTPPCGGHVRVDYWTTIVQATKQKAQALAAWAFCLVAL
jgi:hypothetical protein